MSTNKSTWKKLTSMRLFMPLVCLLAIIIVATITIPGFLSMSLKNGVPYGYPVDVINRASELVILSVGMTLVTAASGGQDISVGPKEGNCGRTVGVIPDSHPSTLGAALSFQIQTTIIIRHTIIIQTGARKYMRLH